MNKYISVICMVLVTATGLVACAKSPVTATASGNSPEQQRANSREAQGELSTDVKR